MWPPNKHSRNSDHLKSNAFKYSLLSHNYGIATNLGSSPFYINLESLNDIKWAASFDAYVYHIVN